jgi:hypothetical protein
MSKGRLSVTTVTSVGAILVAITATTYAQEKPATLAGSWKFNPDRTAEQVVKGVGSDKVSERETMGGGGRIHVGAGGVAGAGAAGGGGGDSRRGGGGGGEAAGGGAGFGRAAGPLGMYSRPIRELKIEQTDSTISLSDPRGTPRVYYLDGRKDIQPLLGGENMEIVAKWKDGKLTVERKVGFDSVKEVYSVDSKTHELQVQVRIASPKLDKPVDSRRIYDPAEGS